MPLSDASNFDFSSQQPPPLPQQTLFTPHTMEDLEMPEGPPSLDAGPEPQGNDDPQDPLRAEIEEENGGGMTPPMADPYADMETREDDEHPQMNANSTAAGERDVAEEGDGGDTNPDNTGAAAEDDDDLESELEELDEKEFENFDPSALNIPDKPLDVDADNVALLGVHKRKRTAEEEAERERKKKKRDKKRDKPKRSKKGDEDDFEGGQEIDGKRSRKGKLGGEGRSSKRAARARTPEEELENLAPEERRRRALERKMDDALKSHRVSRRKAAQDAEERADQEIESMRRLIIAACEKDQRARQQGEVATAKIEILPQVVELMNRNTIQSQLVDPEINILEAIRFMLEPADQDAALPNYQIQRELFAILGKLNISKEALSASAIGKVVLFYTKSTQPQPEIKRQAERLVGEWMRIVLNRGKDRRAVPVETKSYDPLIASSQRPGSQVDRQALAAEKRRKAMVQPGTTNRARVEGGVGTYTIAPVSNLSNAQGVSSRKLGASGEDAFRKIAARTGASTSKGTTKR